MVELRTGLPLDAPQGASPRPEYDPATRTLAEREASKAAELSAVLGRPVSAHTVRWRRRRHQERGIAGMVDGRHAPRRPVHGGFRPEVVDELQHLLAQATDGSTRTVSYYFERVGKTVKDKYGPEAVPKRSAFYRLFQRMERGRHTTGSARTRRSLANQPEGAFGQVTVCRPGELMEIDSTPFDALVRLDQGVVGRVELTGLVDVATRTVTAAVLRPTTKSVDAALLLARSVTPAPMRPGWTDALRMERSVLPYQRLLALDERLGHAAAVPLIIPEAIVVDGGKAFLSKNFHMACDAFGTEVIHAPPRTPTHKPHIERTLGSVATMFAQFVTCPNLPSWPQLDPEHAAESLRAHWQMGDAPTGELTPLLEANGIRTFALPADCGDVGAFSTRQSGTPFVFLPSHLDGEQARQHLAHELGQLVLGHSRPGHRDSRTAAIQFASAFLMPRTAVVAAMLRTATPVRLTAAASAWGVPTSAVLHRLHDLELLPEWSHRSNIQRLGDETPSDHQPRANSVERSHLLPKAVAHLRARGLLVDFVAELTALHTDAPPRRPTVSALPAVRPEGRAESADKVLS